jgi:hypothetical protein
MTEMSATQIRNLTALHSQADLLVAEMNCRVPRRTHLPDLISLVETYVQIVYLYGL